MKLTTNKPLLSIACTQGRRQYMEDTYFASQDRDIFAVFDGHGGDDVAKMCARELENIMKKELRRHPDVSFCMHEVFKSLDARVIENKIGANVGSTAVVAMIRDDRLWISNCGDALGAVGFKNGSATILSSEHKVENEKDRVRALGGMVTYGDGCARINGMVNISRSIGDYHLKKFVIPDPFTTSVLVSSIDYIIIASDGLWDVYNIGELNQEIMNLREQLKSEGISGAEAVDVITRSLVQRTLLRGSTDNITVVYAEISNQGAAARRL